MSIMFNFIFNNNRSSSSSSTSVPTALSFPGDIDDDDDFLLNDIGDDGFEGFEGIGMDWMAMISPPTTTTTPSPSDVLVNGGKKTGEAAFTCQHDNDSQQRLQPQHQEQPQQKQQQRHQQQQHQWNYDTKQLEEVIKSCGPAKLRNLPPKPPTKYPQSAEMLLAHSISTMSITERDKVMEEVHGVVTVDDDSLDEEEGEDDEHDVTTSGSSTTARPSAPQNNLLLPSPMELIKKDLAPYSYVSWQPTSSSTTTGRRGGGSIPGGRSTSEGSTTSSKSSKSSKQPNNSNMKHSKNIDDYLLQMAFEIGKVPNKYAYDAAYAMDADYVTNKDFLKLFLEADSYDVKHAAIRLVSYFENKLEVFGPSKLTKDITQDDLTPHELELVLLGRFHQLCRQRDSAGRLVLFSRPPKDETILLQRVVWYTYHGLLLSADATSLQKGVVLINYNVFDPTYFNFDIYQKPDKDRVWKMVKMIQNIPIKFSAAHFCFDRGHMSGAARVFVNLMVSALESKHMPRTKLHYGSHLEIVHELMSYGISPLSIPLPMEGYAYEQEAVGHRNFFRQVKEKEIMKEKSIQQVRPQEQMEWMDSRVEEKQHDQRLVEEKSHSHQSQQHGNMASSNGPEYQMQELPPKQSDPIKPNLVSSARTVEEIPRIPSTSGSTTPAATAAGPQGVAIPGPYDILLGKGRPLGRHQGNVYFRQVIKLHGDQYDKSNKIEKTELTNKLVESIQASGVRFLKQTDHGWWVEVSHKEAKQKVSHSFRNRRLFQQASNDKEKSIYSASGGGQPNMLDAAGASGPYSLLSVKPNNDKVTCEGCFGFSG